MVTVASRDVSILIQINQSSSRYAFTVASNITVYTMTWVTLGIAGDTQNVVGPNDAPEFRVCVHVILVTYGLLKLA